MNGKTERKIERIQIGSGDNGFNKDHPNFTQVIILLNGNKIAHFTGMYAKNAANLFMEALGNSEIAL